MKISVIGCGYLGAVHATALASLGHQVVGYDIDVPRVESLSAGRPPFYEPGLEDLLQENLRAGRLRFSQDLSDVSGSAVHFLAVGTPQSMGQDTADLSYLNEAVSALTPYLGDRDLVVGKSTVPVGTASELAARFKDSGVGATIVWNPEFLREGHAIADTLRPDRLVYGLPQDYEAARHASTVLDFVYADLLAAGTPKIVASFETAELVKVAANAFLATKISFINALAEICEIVNADVTLLADALGYDDRIGRRFLNAGLGFGGGCLPKDIRAFVARAEELGAHESVAFLRHVDNINLRQRSRVSELAKEIFGGGVRDRSITVLGATFKPDSDDVRDSPALDVAEALHRRGARVSVTDPKGLENARRRNPNLLFVDSISEALEGAELVILATEWQEYRNLDPRSARQMVGERLKAPSIIDARNVLSRVDWVEAGWDFWALGR